MDVLHFLVMVENGIFIVRKCSRVDDRSNEAQKIPYLSSFDKKVYTVKNSVQMIYVKEVYETHDLCDCSRGGKTKIQSFVIVTISLNVHF